MRWIINYFRQCFCKHDWLVEELEATEEFYGSVVRQGDKVYMRCKKCGYHQKHWKA